MKLFGHKPTTTAWFGLVVIAICVFVAVFTPWMAPYPESANIGGTWDEPSATMWLGADQIGRLVEGGPAGHPGRRAHLVGDHVGEGRLSESRGAMQQHVLHRLFPLLHGLDRDREPLDQRRLTDVLRDRPRSDHRRRHRGIGGPHRLLGLGLSGNDALSCHARIIGGRPLRRQSGSMRNGIEAR